jgi:hypothetical protein
MFMGFAASALRCTAAQNKGISPISNFGIWSNKPDVNKELARPLGLFTCVSDDCTAPLDRRARTRCGTHGDH